MIGQLLIDYTRLTPARVLVSFVVIGVMLSALGIYGPLSDWAGSGANTPLTGFGNLLAEGTKKAVEEDGLIGAFKGPLSAGSVGIMGAIVSGLVVSLFAKPKSK